MMHRIAAFAFATALLAPLGASAGAPAVLTGTYEGKMSCKGLDSGVPTKAKTDVTLLVVQEGSDLVASLGVEALGGYVIPVTAKPGSGLVGLTSCQVNQASLGDALQLSFKAKGDKVKLTGDIIRYDREGLDLDVCTLSLNRTNVAIPEPTLCPE